MLKSIRLQNLLSFGQNDTQIDLLSLNVLIGPNGSGKSNLIEAIGLLRSAPKDLMTPIISGGGVHDWLWKGSPNSPEATIDAVFTADDGPNHLRYILSFQAAGQIFQITDERIENELPNNQGSVYFFYKYSAGQGVLNVKGKKRFLQREEIERNASILSQRKDPDAYPEITRLGNYLSKIKLYREWSFGRFTAPRLPQRPDQPNDFLMEDASNLGLVPNKLRRDPAAKSRLLMSLRKLYEGIDDYEVQIDGGTVQVFFQEGRFTVPATRLSDGTLRYLCLLAILCHPTPPPLICIEEPELGLHPDILPTLAELMKEAAERTQLIITTHSDVLVDAMTDCPEAVLTVDKTIEGTTLNRLNAEELRPWLENYRLGELWARGDIGATRW